MFQSSSIASGKFFRHVSIASSPFSASAIWKSSPSSIRRATLRMTLESSTTKHVFIASSLLTVRASPLRSQFQSVAQSALPSCRRLGPDVEHAIHVEHYQQLTVQPMHSGRHGGELAVEVDGVCLDIGIRQPEYLAKRVDQKAE